MRILHLDPDDLGNPLAGGGPLRTFEICRRLARQHEVTVLTPTFPGSTPELVRDGVRYVRLGRKIRDHGSSHHITFLASLPRAVRQFDYDLLVEDFMPPASATWTPLFRRRSKPFVGVVQWFSARRYTEWLKLPFHWGEEYGVRLYPNLIVLSDDMRQRMLARHLRGRVEVIPNGVPDELFDIPISPGDHLLYLGRVEVEAKGIDLLLQALAAIPEQRRPRLVLAGNVQDADALAHWLDRTGTRAWVDVRGPYDAAGRVQLLQACRALVMPSRWETFGMVIAEANAAGRPVIVWNRPPMNEVVGPGGWRVQPEDVEALAAAMQAAMAAPDAELARRGEVDRAHARRYNWDAVTAQQLAFYEQLRERHAHARRKEPA